VIERERSKKEHAEAIDSFEGISVLSFVHRLFQAGRVYNFSIPPHQNGELSMASRKGVVERSMKDRTTLLDDVTSGVGAGALKIARGK